MAVSDSNWKRFCSFLTVFAGFALTKAEYFPTEAARGGAQFVMVRHAQPLEHYVYVMRCRVD